MRNLTIRFRKLNNNKPVNFKFNGLVSYAHFNPYKPGYKLGFYKFIKQLYKNSIYSCSMRYT
ncbi:MAG: hypothetical protein K0R54_641 [Clostridiaceae bacterium]|jgi:hypothetical protein|nr:hypothetical protein [Clostridiaceae bacterium]